MYNLDLQVINKKSKVYKIIILPLVTHVQSTNLEFGIR